MAPTLPGVTVSASAVSGNGSPGGNVGSWFVTGLAERGPLAPDPLAPISSMADFVNRYGARVAWSGLWDAVDAFFHSGGSRLFFSRVVGPAAASSSLTLMDRAGTPLATLVVKPLGPGDYGTRYTVQVVAGVGANSYQLVIAFDTVVQERSGDLFSPTDAVVWAQKNSKHVVITSSGSATAAPNNNPAVVAATSLSGGSDDRASIVDAQWQAGLDRFTNTMGPGLVSAPGRGTTAAHTQLISHGITNNRQAILDAPDLATQATLSSLAVAARAATGSDEYGALFAPWLVVPGITSSTARRVPASSVAAGRISGQISNGTVNVPAGGANGEIPWVDDVGQTFTDAERGTLNGDGVNVLRKAYGSANITIYGYRTLDTSDAWPLLNNQLLRLKITDECALIGEGFMFAQIDARGHTVSRFKAALSGMLQAHYDADELFGAAASDAFAVETGAGVNTVESLAAGVLAAKIALKMSPFAEQVQMIIVKVPLTDQLVTA